MKVNVFHLIFYTINYSALGVSYYTGLKLILNLLNLATPSTTWLQLYQNE